MGVAWSRFGDYLREHTEQGFVYNRLGSGDLGIYRDRIDHETPVLLRVNYKTEQDETYDHFVLGIGYTKTDTIVPRFHDPATIEGSGYNGALSDMKINRKHYQLAGMDWYQPL